MKKDTYLHTPKTERRIVSFYHGNVGGKSREPTHAPRANCVSGGNTFGTTAVPEPDLRDSRFTNRPHTHALTGKRVKQKNKVQWFVRSGGVCTCRGTGKRNGARKTGPRARLGDGAGPHGAARRPPLPPACSVPGTAPVSVCPPPCPAATGAGTSSPVSREQTCAEVCVARDRELRLSDPV